MVGYQVVLTKKAEKSLKKLPKYLVVKLYLWIELVEIIEVNKHEY